MKAYKNTNAEKIKQFICLKPRTRKEIVKFVVCDLNKTIAPNDFNDAYKGSYRGYYSAFFRDCTHNGNIVKIDGKYHITESCLNEGNGLWSMNKDRQIELLNNQLKYDTSVRHDLRVERRENANLYETLKETKHYLAESRANARYYEEKVKELEITLKNVLAITKK